MKLPGSTKSQKVVVRTIIGMIYAYIIVSFFGMFPQIFADLLKLPKTLGIVVFILIGIVLTYIAFDIHRTNVQRKERTEGLRQVVDSLGFTFESQNVFPQVRFGEFHEFSIMGSVSNNIMTGSLSGQLITVMDCTEYPGGRGFGGPRNKRTLAFFPEGAKGLPDFQLFPGGGGPAKILKALARRNIAFPETEEFSKNYTVYSVDEKAVQRAFGANMRAFFAANQGWTVETLNGAAVIYRQRKLLDPAEIAAFLAEASKVLEAFHEAQRFESASSDFNEISVEAEGERRDLLIAKDKRRSKITLYIMLSIIFAMAVLPPIYFYFRDANEDKRAEELRNLAVNLGFKFEERYDELDTRFGKFHVFTNPYLDFGKNIITGSLAGQRVTVFEYCIPDPRSGMRCKTKQTLAFFPEGAKGLPDFQLSSQGKVYGTDEAIKSAFGANMRAFFAANQGWAVETLNGDAMIIQDKLREPAEIAAFLAEASKVLDAIKQR